MSKLSKVVKGTKKVAEKVNHPPFLSVIIPAKLASPAPPLGTQLGQVLTLNFHFNGPSISKVP